MPNSRRNYNRGFASQSLPFSFLITSLLSFFDGTVLTFNFFFHIFSIIILVLVIFFFHFPLCAIELFSLLIIISFYPKQFKRIDHTGELKKFLDNTQLHDWCADWPDKSVSFVAQSNNRPVGFIIAYNLFPNRLDELYIEFVVVEPDFQKRGIESELLNKIEQAATLMNVTKLILYTEIDETAFQR